MRFYVFNTSSDKASVNCNLSLCLWNIEHKPSVKKDGQPGRSMTGPTGVDFEFYPSGGENPDRFHLWCELAEDNNLAKHSELGSKI